MRHSMVRTTRFLLLVGFGLLAMMPAQLGAHQATGCLEGVTAEPLGRGLPDAVDGYELILLRVTFEPGGFAGEHIHPGSLTLAIESGTLTYAVVEGEAEVIRATDDDTSADPELLSAGDDTVMEPGDWLFEQGIIHTAHNDGDEPTVVLVAGLMQEGEAFTQCVE